MLWWLRMKLTEGQAVAAWLLALPLSMWLAAFLGYVVTGVK